MSQPTECVPEAWHVAESPEWSRMKQHEAAEPFLIEETSLLEFLQHQVKQIYLEYEGNHQPQRLDLVCAVLLQPCTLQHGHGGKMSVDTAGSHGQLVCCLKCSRYLQMGLSQNQGIPWNTPIYPNLWPWHQGKWWLSKPEDFGVHGVHCFWIKLKDQSCATKKHGAQKYGTFLNRKIVYD